MVRWSWKGSKQSIRKYKRINEKSKPRTKEAKEKKRNTYESAYALYEGRDQLLMLSELEYLK